MSATYNDTAALGDCHWPLYFWLTKLVLASDSHLEV